MDLVITIVIIKGQKHKFCIAIFSPYFGCCCLCLPPYFFSPSYVYSSKHVFTSWSFALHLQRPRYHPGAPTQVKSWIFGQIVDWSLEGNDDESLAGCIPVLPASKQKLEVGSEEIYKYEMKHSRWQVQSSVQRCYRLSITGTETETSHSLQTLVTFSHYWLIIIIIFVIAIIIIGHIQIVLI